MKYIFFLVSAVVAVGLGVFVYKGLQPAVNPDPNHLHADFAVWIDGKQLDFSGPEFMSAPPAEAASLPFVDAAFAHGDEEDGHVVPGREYLHLHNGNGHVIHVHKPGLTIGDFFDSLSMPMTDACLTVNPQRSYCIEDGKRWRMFVNGEEAVFGPNYVLKDLDKILLTWGSDDAAIAEQLKKLTDDACLYSQTCPWRGTPPAENCIADPAVPCVE